MYELIIEMAHTVWKNGFSLTALGTAVYVLLKQRAVKKRLRRFIPWLLADDSETKHYVANQARIEMKVDLLLQERGIEWNVITIDGEQRYYLKDSRSRLLSSPKNTIAPSTDKSTNWRRKIMNKFKSRKFILAVVGAVLIILNDGLDLGVDSDTVIAFAGLLAVWITGESVVDTARAKRDTPPGDTGPAE